MDELKTKQQVIDKLKQAEKVLVTVSKNPSVDALSAALGLTLLLDEQKKYATAIFSGETPPALAFLEPEKTFDDTTDSLRDFIIALNKEKADHLRYKVVDDAVKIFITPYKTTITEEDLEFSQGDYNVELVIAVGVDSQEDLDAALDNHGQILHDAAIVTISAGDQTSTLGGIDWRDAGASSLSEMVASLVDGLKKDKKEQLLTAPIATALLTGIVAETERFSNERTTSRAMTIAATLMSAGADQQLIANELQSAEATETSVINSEVVEEGAPEEPSDSDTPDAISDGAGGLSIHHDPSERPVKKAPTDEGETLAELDERVRGKTQEEIITEEAKRAAEIPAHGPQPEESSLPVEGSQPEVPEIGEIHSAVSAAPVPEEGPALGGTLNATTARAEDDARQAAESTQNATILTHAYLGDDASTPEAGQGAVNDVAEPNDVPAGDVASLTEVASAHAMNGEKVIEPLHDISALAQPAEDSAPAANAYGLEQGAVEAPLPAPDMTLPMPPPIPDFSQMGAAPAPALPLPPSEPTQILGDILNPAPEAPQVIPMTDVGMSSAYAVDGEASAASQSATVPLVAAPVPQQPAQPSGAYSADPGQYQIPAQQ
ncbi:hypothetical protein KI440_03930 [Candidatus Saccharibacteria bacterium TM7i]|nr:hypothetical protein KI440_03930 [Candidatus Saccharibacteria bacterium TM7i]